MDTVAISSAELVKIVKEARLGGWGRPDLDQYIAGQILDHILTTRLSGPMPTNIPRRAAALYWDGKAGCLAVCVYEREDDDG